VLTPQELSARASAESGKEMALVAAMNSLNAHIVGQQVMTATELGSASASFSLHRKLLKTKTSLIDQAFALVQAFETSAHGPLFVKSGGFSRSGFGDGRDLDRAMLVVYQAIIDDIYNWPGLIANCSASLFQGRAWQTAAYFPGAVAPPLNPTVVHTIALNATSPAIWGIPVGFRGRTGSIVHARKPTGLYLSPGLIATVNVPSTMVNSGFKVLVGAHTADNSNKPTNRRLDRSTTTFDITSPTLLVSNPLGGGLYILVPYLASLDRVEVQISGGVVEAPLFQRTSIRQMTNEEWLSRRGALGPWADLETDKFMLNVPRDWIYRYDDPVALLRTYDLAMDGTAEIWGYPPAMRSGGVHTLFLQPDLQIRASAYGVGYPQVNVEFRAGRDYGGNANEWMIQNATQWYVTWHELCHIQQRQDLTFQYRGETEAIVNYMWVYIHHVKFGLDFHWAFATSRGTRYEAYRPDDAAVHWMITPNFRDGKEMDRTNSEFNEIRYQHRGYAKYADITRLFGWEAFTSYYFQENSDYMRGVRWQDPEYNFGLAANQANWPDIRTLRLSISVGYDLTPLIHFWGIFPVNAGSLRSQMAAQNIKASNQIRCLLIRYRSLIPADNTAFNDFFEKIYPGRPTTPHDPRYGRGWYNAWRDTYTEVEGNAAKAQLDAIISMYFGADRDSPCENVSTGIEDVPRPSSYKWMGEVHSITAPTATTTTTPTTTIATHTIISFANFLMHNEASGSGNWHQVGDVIRQTDNIHSGSYCSKDQLGTIFYVANVAGPDYTWSVDVASQDNDGVGVIFRMQDTNNFYKYSHTNDGGGCRTLYKIRNGVRSELWRATSYTNYVQQYTATYQFKVTVAGCHMTGMLDSKVDFDVMDTDCVASGGVGLYSWGNSAGQWSNWRLITQQAGITTTTSAITTTQAPTNDNATTAAVNNATDTTTALSNATTAAVSNANATTAAISNATTVAVAVTNATTAAVTNATTAAVSNTMPTTTKTTSIGAATVYVKGDAGANQCPAGSTRIVLESQCQSAATYFSRGFATEDTGSWPKGCYEYQSGKFYFNRHSSGSGDSRAALICDKAVISNASTTGWLIRAKTTMSGWAWDVKTLGFMTTSGKLLRLSDCQVIHSGSVSDGKHGGIPGYEATNAFQNNAGLWGGRRGSDGTFFIGLMCSQTEDIRFVQIAQGTGHYAVEVSIERSIRQNVWQVVHTMRLQHLGSGHLQTYQIPSHQATANITTTTDTTTVQAFGTEYNGWCIDGQGNEAGRSGDFLHSTTAAECWAACSADTTTQGCTWYSCGVSCGHCTKYSGDVVQGNGHGAYKCRIKAVFRAERSWYVSQLLLYQCSSTVQHVPVEQVATSHQGSYQACPIASQTTQH
jgi:hypothetical protein